MKILSTQNQEKTKLCSLSQSSHTYLCMCTYACAVAIIVKWLSHVWLFATPWTVAHQAPLSMSTGFSREEHWSGLPFPPPGDLLEPRIEPTSPSLAGGHAHKHTFIYMHVYICASPGPRSYTYTCVCVCVCVCNRLWTSKWTFSQPHITTYSSILHLYNYIDV